MDKFLAICIVAFNVCRVIAQDSINIILIKDIPDGGYMSLQDIMDKKVVKNDYLYQKGFGELRGKDLTIGNSENMVFFFDREKDKKVKDFVAIKYHGNLYFQQRMLRKYSRSGDGGQEGDAPHLFHRVIREGKHWYLEGIFMNQWAKGYAQNNLLMGPSLLSNHNKLKGVFFRPKELDFDFIKNCSSFNEYLQENMYSEKFDCKKEFSIKEVRKILFPDMQADEVNPR